MTNKYQAKSKIDSEHAPAGKTTGENEAILPESHSQDADRHRKAPHPKSDK